MDFLYHTLSEKDKEEIKKQVAVILDSFSKKLSQIDREIKEQAIEREEYVRKEKINQKEPSKKENMPNFSRQKMFENAPDKNEDSIIAEKKKW